MKSPDEKKPSHLHMRCHGEDKGTWTRAANAAVKRGLLIPDSRGNLASWVVRTLNACAARELSERKPT